MAGDWLKVETTTPSKAEVWQIADRLELDPDAVFGKLFRVWSWFDSHSENGNAPSVTKKLLDREVCVTGFCDAMIEAGWMIDRGGLISLPNFTRHNGKTAKNRALTAKRVADHKKKSNADGNGKVTPDALPREEKRRINSLSGQAPIPPDWQPDDATIAYAQIHNLPHSDLVVQKFKDHFADKGLFTADPNAAYRKWLANERKPGGTHGANRKSRFESDSEAIDGYIESALREGQG